MSASDEGYGVSGRRLSGDGWSGDFGGLCPVQGFGAVDGSPFYFRARGSSWELAVAVGGEKNGDAIDVACGARDGFRHREDWPGDEDAASWMETADVTKCMERAVEAFRKATETK